MGLSIHWLFMHEGHIYASVCKDRHCIGIDYKGEGINASLEWNAGYEGFICWWNEKQSGLCGFTSTLVHSTPEHRGHPTCLHHPIFPPLCAFSSNSHTATSKTLGVASALDSLKPKDYNTKTKSIFWFYPLVFLLSAQPTIFSFAQSLLTRYLAYRGENV